MLTQVLRPHPPGTRLQLTDGMAVPPPGLPSKEKLERALAELRERLQALQAALGAEAKRAILVIFQGRDASGKDGAIRRVFGGLNPARCTVTSFKRPSLLELSHDYLWRVHQAIPVRGTIGVFNRSHYEDLIAVRIRRLVAESVWRKRFDHINAFEAMLADEGVVIRKFFLHISMEEQRQRLEDRLSDPTKNWKFAVGDLEERSRWDEYSAAYQEVLERCSTDYAPWYLVPADKKLGGDLLVLEVLVRTLELMNPQYPPADREVLALKGSIE
ncbi:MAG TPA: PPK2 family polyphosphate kinase [Gemmatimonadales bacterium]|jgi:PPK2 family polyphosphate:nucleotide phosphotransferase|nr:PPK2 family polyphosphate kinase [Gemmatimonadales bacterium]